DAHQARIQAGEVPHRVQRDQRPAGEKQLLGRSGIQLARRAMTVTERAPSRAVYLHPWFVRITHWSNAVAFAVMAMSGLQIFDAFPSFGPKIPQADLIAAVPK